MSNAYSLANVTIGRRRRRAASASSARVASFSALSSSSRACCHSSAGHDLRFLHTPISRRTRRAGRRLGGGQACLAQSSKSRSASATQASPASGSTHRKLPERPKWPNVRGEFRDPVQCGALLSLISKPRPQSQFSWRPKPGSTPDRPGKATLVASASSPSSTRDGLASSTARFIRSPSGPTAPQAGSLPAGWPPCRAAGRSRRPAAARRAGRTGRRRGPRRSRCRGWSRSRRRPGWARIASLSKASPDACDSRCRIVDPGGPASSRSSRPRCTASSAASATSSLVTDAQRNGRAAGPAVSITPRGRRDADRRGDGPGRDLIEWIWHRPRVDA